MFILDILYQRPAENIVLNCLIQLRIWNTPMPTARDVLLGLVQHWDFSSNVVSEMLETIQTLGFNDDNFVDAIAEHISDRGYCVADNVAYTLGVLRNPTPKVLAALEWALTAGEMYFAEDFIRSSAAWALGELGVSSPSILSGLQALAKSANARESQAATEALGKLGKG